MTVSEIIQIITNFKDQIRKNGLNVLTKYIYDKNIYSNKK